MKPNELRPAIEPRTAIERRLQGLQSSATQASPDAAVAALVDLHAQMGAFVEAAKVRLLATALDWTDEQKAEAGWIHATSLRAATVAFKVTESLRQTLGPDDPRMLLIISLALLYMGESMKWEIAAGAKVPRDYRSLNALMRRAISTGRERDPIHLLAGGRNRTCTLESLYFRALLLARFASGALSPKQTEIFDEWLWIWVPILKGVTDPPSGSVLRADLDSGHGLQRGPRENEGPALYMPQEPIEAAFRSLLAQFQAGRIVPSEGCTADFRIEEHVAVLDLIRRDLRTSTRTSTARAQRKPTDRIVELHVGLTEITAQGSASAPSRAATIVLAAKNGVTRNAVRERDQAIDGIYDRAVRQVTLANVSETGLGLEGSQADCGALGIGELVGLRIAPFEPLVIGRVIRSIPATTPGRVIVGVSRLTSGARRVEVTASASRGARVTPMLYVPGDDASGAHDAYLVGDRTFAEGGSFEVDAGDNFYRFRFNRVRGRGRGWVLAGFEILAVRPAMRETATG